MTAIEANGIRIEAEARGPKEGAPLLLIRGLGTQLIHWPDRLLDGFAAAGCQVVIFDNRDAGLSERIAAAGRPDVQALAAAVAAGETPRPSYTLDDMADDAAGVLDAFGIASAHVLGISMGGMILQTLALRRPERLRSATIVMSSSGAADLPPRDPQVDALLWSQADDPSDREQVIDHTLRCDRVFGSPGYPFDADERRALIARAYDRAHDPDGVMRQGAAVLGSPPRAERLARIDAPTLIIHGTDDALLPIEHGRDLARRIPGAELREVEGMGHDLEGGICDIVLEATLRLIRRAEG
ncbi:MAG: alpha/beta fold hydrolase [Pseudomonadota bacterium]